MTAGVTGRRLRRNERCVAQIARREEWRRFVAARAAAHIGGGSLRMHFCVRGLQPFALSWSLARPFGRERRADPKPPTEPTEPTAAAGRPLDPEQAPDPLRRTRQGCPAAARRPLSSPHHVAPHRPAKGPERTGRTRAHHDPPSDRQATRKRWDHLCGRPKGRGHLHPRRQVPVALAC